MIWHCSHVIACVILLRCFEKQRQILNTMNLIRALKNEPPRDTIRIRFPAAFSHTKDIGLKRLIAHLEL